MLWASSGATLFYTGYQGNRMKLRSAALSACLCLLASVAFASAADAQVVGQKTSSFYIRGDLGGAFSTHTKLTDTDSGAPNASLGTTSLAGDDGNSFLMEGGLGLQLNQYFRVDGTVTAMPFIHFNSTDGAQPKGNGAAESSVGLINVYLELNKVFNGLFAGSEPYIDGGLGAAYNQFDHFTYTDQSNNTTSLSSNGHFDMAWAVGAGVGFPITRDLKLDVSYRFLSLGYLETGPTEKIYNGTDLGATTQSKALLQAHTIMIGLRYTFYRLDMF